MRTRGRDRAMLLALAPTVVVLFFVSLSGVLLSDDPTRHAGVGDTYAYIGPAQFFLDTSLRDGDLPLWNPHTYSGMPFAAHPLSMAFYPPNLVRSMLSAATTPRDTLVSLYGLALFHLLALAFGMYGLARREGLRPDTSFVVAVAVPLSSQWLVFSVTNIALICGTSWMPLILLCLNRAVAEEEPRRRASWFVVGGLVYGLQILAGFFQAAIYASFVYVLYVSVPAAIRLRRHPSAVTTRELAARVSGLALFGATGTLLAAAIALPSVELMGASARAAANYHAYQAGQESVNLSTWAWIGMLLERVGPGFIAARNAVAAAAVWILSLNLGLLIAAVAAALSDRRRTVIVYAAASYVLVDLVMGSPMPLASLVDAILPFETSSPFYSSVLCMSHSESSRASGWRRCSRERGHVRRQDVRPWLLPSRVSS